MRIGISTSVIQRGRSGVGQYVLALLRALLPEAVRHEFTLFVLENDLPLFDFAGGAMRVRPVAEAHRPPARDILWHHVTLPRLARELGLDVLHVPSYRRLLWDRTCPLVGTIHDLAPFRLPKKYDRARMFYGRVVVRQLARRQDEIVAISQTTANDVRRFFQVPPARITVIPNGLDHERFTPGDHDAATATIVQRHGLRAPFFLYVARLEHPGKNHVRLITAFNQFKAEVPSPWQLVLLGSDWHGAEAIHQAVRRSPYAADIHCPGFVAAEDLPTWYRAAGAFVYPSLFEGFGLPPLEAMACGCPVIASNISAIAEVCGDAAVLTDPQDVAGLRRELARVAFDAPLRERLRVAGRAQARRFDWRHTAAATLDVYARAARRLKAPVLAPPITTPAR